VTEENGVFFRWSFSLPRVEPSPLVLRPLIDLLYQAWVMYDDDCRKRGGMIEWQVKRSTGREAVPGSLWPPQIPHELTRARTRAAVV
jgi:hypothetical protein